MDHQHYEMVAKAIDYLLSSSGGETDLESLSAHYGYESTYFQKIFKDYVGISPKRLTQFMAYKTARDFLLQGYPTLDAAYEAGLSGNGRLHDLFVSIEAATPGAVQARGEGMNISYGVHATPLGEMLIAQTVLGVCWAAFVMDEDRQHSIGRMKAQWPNAVFSEDQISTARTMDHILSIWRGNGKGKVKLDLHGTNFQIQVWRALLKIPAGATVHYGSIAAALGEEKASRAVGTAIGRNPVALLIPCHRVIQKSGIVENYAWGTSRKKMLLAIETNGYEQR